MQTSYVIALGSNQRHNKFGRPERILRAALAPLAAQLTLKTVSRIITSAPVGPSHRRYANAAALIETTLSPDALLHILKQSEHDFGRRSRGERWRARPLDLDIILWSNGAWESEHLIIPHPLFRQRRFVLSPVQAIAGQWRDPITGLQVNHLKARLDRARLSP